MRRILITIAYDGTAYCGWQTQPNGITVEEVLNKVISKTFKEDIKIIGASRTDAGVHAVGQVAVFDTDCSIAVENIPIAINSNLPDDIAVQSAEEVPMNFHPRHGNITKTYEYRIWTNRIPDPVRSRYTCYHHYKLSIDKMREATSYLIGTHDFASFCSAKSDVKNTVRTIYSIDIEKDGNEIVLTFTGDGFLYNMIRMIAGVLMKIGDGYIEPEEIVQILSKKERGFARPTAPAKGLCLLEIYYE